MIGMLASLAGRSVTRSFLMPAAIAAGGIAIAMLSAVAFTVLNNAKAVGALEGALERSSEIAQAERAANVRLKASVDHHAEIIAEGQANVREAEGQATRARAEVRRLRAEATQEGECKPGCTIRLPALGEAQ